MLGKNNSFIFIQPPKNATTSIRNWLMEKGLAEEGPWKRHTKARQMRGALDQNLWEKALKFSVIRNPYDRFVSHYLYFAKIALNPSDAVRGKPLTLMAEQWISKCDNFNDFVKMGLLDKRLNGYLKGTTQHSFVGDFTTDFLTIC